MKPVCSILSETGTEDSVGGKHSSNMYWISSKIFLRVPSGHPKSNLFAAASNLACGGTMTTCLSRLQVTSSKDQTSVVILLLAWECSVVAYDVLIIFCSRWKVPTSFSLPHTLLAEVHLMLKTVNVVLNVQTWRASSIEQLWIIELFIYLYIEYTVYTYLFFSDIDGCNSMLLPRHVWLSLKHSVKTFDWSYFLTSFLFAGFCETSCFISGPHCTTPNVGRRHASYEIPPGEVELAVVHHGIIMVHLG